MAVIKIEAKKDTRCTQTICLIQGDRRTQILRFSVNRYDGGVDLSDLVWCIKTVNAKGIEDVFEPTAVEIGESRITIDWLVDGTVTAASGTAKYELNGLDATVEGKAVIWKGGTGTMSLRANIGENFGNIDMSNIDRLVLYVEGRLQHIIDLTEELQGAGETANTAAEAANAGANRANTAASAAEIGAASATTAASNASAAAEAANAAALPHAQLYGVRVCGETAKAIGNPVTFLPDAGSLLKPVTVLAPKQEGNGDPYPAGGSKNLLPVSTRSDYTHNGITWKNNNDGSWTINGTATGSSYPHGTTSVWTLGVLPAGKYTASITPASAASSAFVRIGNHSSGGAFVASTTSTSNFVTFTANGTSSYGVSIGVENGKRVDNVTIFVQVEAGDTATEYAPYSNIRPISSWDKLELNAVGKNLADARLYNKQFVVANVYLKAGQTYVLSVSNTPTGLYFSSVDMVTNYAVNYSAPSLAYTAQSDGEYLVRAYYQNNDASLDCNMQLEIGSAPSAYEPYASKLHTVQIGQTVYGLRYEWLTGKGLIEWAMQIFDGTEVLTLNAYATSLGKNAYAYYNAAAPYTANHCVCSHFKSENWFSGRNYSVYMPNSENIVFQTDGAESVAAFKAYLAAQYAAGTPVQIVYKLATPIEIQFTPTLISAADPEQTNTLYGDGNIEVEYIKPLHVSIEEHVAAAVAAAMQTE